MGADRQEGAIPLDDVVASTNIGDDQVAYLDGMGTVHVGPPKHRKEEGEPLMRDYSLEPHQAVELATFVKNNS